MSVHPENLPNGLEQATKISGGVRVPAHSSDRPSLHKPPEDSREAKLLDKHEQAIIAQNAKALSDQLYEVDNQQHQQRTGNGKGVASTYHAPHFEKASHSPKLTHHRQINQPGGAQACNRF